MPEIIILNMCLFTKHIPVHVLITAHGYITKQGLFRLFSLRTLTSGYLSSHSRYNLQQSRCRMSDDAKIKCVIDTDAGTDDAQAIALAMASPGVEVVGITTVHGNTSARQVTTNVLRLLKVLGKEEIPIFMGAETSLFGDVKESGDFHGKDGLGDMQNPEPVDINKVSKEHASDALLRLSKELQGELTLIAIGPLTNVATAIRRDPQFGSRLKQCYIMGGNYYGRGNAKTLCAEFNFYCDPEAAHIVLNQIGCPITLAGLELCFDNPLTWDMHADLRSVNTRVGTFFKIMEQDIVGSWGEYIPCDEYAVAALVNPTGIVLESKHVYASVELSGRYTRGQMVIDWRNHLKKDKNVTIVTKTDHRILYKMIKMAMQGNVNLEEL